MKITLKDIAKEAGVSVSMVSYVLNKSGKPTLESHKRILEIARAHNYVPDANARGLVTGVTHNIGLIVPQKSEIFAQPFMVKCLQEFSRTLSENAGWLSLCLGSDLSPATMRRYLANVRVDGIILLYAEDTADLAEMLSARRTPFIFFDRANNRGQGSCIAADDRAGMGMLFDHLHGLGHRDMLFLSGLEGPREGARDRRLAAWQEKTAQAGLPQPMVLYGGYTKHGGYLALRDHLDRGGPLPGAIAAGNDRMAWGALKLLAERDIRVPEDVSVTGFDDADEEFNEDIGLTTARQPIAEMARFCVQHLYERGADGNMEPVNIRLMPELIIRKTTATPR